MMNVITPKWYVVEADRLVHLASNKSLEANLVTIEITHRGHRRWRVCSR